MFGITGGRTQRWRQAKRGGGTLRILGVAPHRGHVSNFGDVPAPCDSDGLRADSMGYGRL